MNPDTFLRDIKKQYAYYKRQADQAMVQLTDDQFFVKADGGSNSIAVIVKHLSGNLLSRFTDFKHADGEKTWRDRDQEFIVGSEERSDLLDQWERAWQILEEALDSLEAKDLDGIIHIRNHPHHISTALLRSITHTASHVGQIIYAAKAMLGDSWNNLSIPVGESEAFNQSSKGDTVHDQHYTDLLK